MSESLGLTSHKSSCNCTGCGLLRAGVCINCAEKIAALILECGPGELAAQAVLRCLPRGDRAVLLHAARALARAVSAVAVGATVTDAMPRRAIGKAAGAFDSGSGNRQWGSGKRAPARGHRADTKENADL